MADDRPEKEQWKQVEALAILFEKKPEWKQKGVRLVMMGGARHPADEARVESLKALARERGIEVSGPSWRKGRTAIQQGEVETVDSLID